MVATMPTSYYQGFTKYLTGNELSKNVVILGSAPSATQAARLLGAETIVVALNNAHRAVPRIDFAFYAGDFPAERRHAQVGRIGRSTPHYLPALQAFGGPLYCGATIAFAAAYWAIVNFPYAQVSFYGCDMVYPAEQSHFYGQGQPDPLRRNMSLQNLRAKSLRIFYFGLTHHVLFLNASQEVHTRLAVPQLKSGRSLSETLYGALQSEFATLVTDLDRLAQPALALEASAPFDAQRTDYWVYANEANVWTYTAAIDDLWMALDEPVRHFEELIDEMLA